MRRQRRIRCRRSFLLDSESQRRRHNAPGNGLRRSRLDRWSSVFDDALHGGRCAGLDNGFDRRLGLYDRRRRFINRLFDQRRGSWRGRHFDFRDRSRDRRRFDRFDETRRRKSGRRRLWRFGRFLGRRTLSSLDDGCFRKDVARWQRDLALSCQPFDELPPDDLFNRARRALHLDAMVTLQQRRDFLARGVEQFRDFIYPDSCQPLTSKSIRRYRVPADRLLRWTCSLRQRPRPLPAPAGFQMRLPGPRTVLRLRGASLLRS